MRPDHKFGMIILVCTSFFLGSLAIAKPAPAYDVIVEVTNLCNKSITYHIDNNWGTRYMGNHTLSANGAKDDKGNPMNSVNFFFGASNDEEFYTISYQNASCKIDYPMIKHNWSLAVTISNCDTTPKCEVH